MLRRLGQALGWVPRPVTSDTQTAATDTSSPSPARLSAPPPPRTRTADRARVTKGTAPPLLAELYASGFDARVAEVRAGRAGFAAEERREVFSRLLKLDGAQRNALRQALVAKPPHPGITKDHRRDPALVGPPSALALMRILSGALFGAAPAAGDSHQQQVDALLEAPYWKPGEAEKLRPALLQSDSLLALGQRFGPATTQLLDVFGLEGVDALGLDLFSAQNLANFVHERPEGLPQAKAYLDQHGPQALCTALEQLDDLRFHGGIHAATAVGALGFAGAVELSKLIDADPHGMRAYREHAPPESLLEHAARGPQVARRVLAEAGARVVAFGSGGVSIRRAEAPWPSLELPSGPAAQRAEAALLTAVDLPVDALQDPSKLDVTQASAVIAAMQSKLHTEDPERGARLDREVAGRRFVSRKYYDDLYAKGAANPEHRYSVETFEGHRAASAFVAQAARQDRGTPLTARRIERLLCEIHQRVAESIVTRGESHLRAEHLGRFRAVDEEHVQLGDGIHHLSPEVAAKIAANPYLQSDDITYERGEAQVRPISFAKGSDVPRMVRETARWIVDNEASLSPEALAAEAHFRLVSIHPFMDGNGRTSKLMVDYLLARADVAPPIWRTGDILANRDTWPQAIAEGVQYHLHTVRRHFQDMAEASG